MSITKYDKTTLKLILNTQSIHNVFLIKNAFLPVILLTSQIKNMFLSYLKLRTVRKSKKSALSSNGSLVLWTEATQSTDGTAYPKSLPLP